MFFTLCFISFVYARDVAVSITNLPEDIAYNETYFGIIKYTFDKLGVDVTLHAYHPDPDDLSVVEVTHQQMVDDGIDYAIIGDTISSTTSKLVVEQDRYVFLNGGKEIPIISNSATSDTLSNKDDYPNFLRTIPVDSASYQSIVELVSVFNYKKVAMIYTSDASGTSGYFRVNKLCNEKNIALLGVCYGTNMSLSELEGISVIISNMYMEELFDTWTRFPESLNGDYLWVLTDAATVISEDQFIEGGFEEAINNKTDIIIASLLSADNDITDEILNEFGSTPLGMGYYDCVVTLVKGWESCGENNYSYSAFTDVEFVGATGRTSFDSNGDRIGIMGMNRLLIGNDGYPLIAQYYNGMTFEDNWDSYLLKIDKSILNASMMPSIMFLSFILFALIF
ncbi:Receptor ligand binding region domain-containing protein [Entamoeba marina]